MTEDEKTAFMAALDEQFGLLHDESSVLHGYSEVEHYAARERPDGSWRVTVLWRQSHHRHGVHVDQLTDVSGSPEPTVADAAYELRAFLVQEPHDPTRRLDSDGRSWHGPRASGRPGPPPQ